jgi:hypothetical protein
VPEQHDEAIESMEIMMTAPPLAATRTARKSVAMGMQNSANGCEECGQVANWRGAFGLGISAEKCI